MRSVELDVRIALTAPAEPLLAEYFHDQVGAHLRDIRPEILEDGHQRVIAHARLTLSRDPAHRQVIGLRAHRVADKAGAQIGIGDATFGIGTHPLLRERQQGNAFTTTFGEAVEFELEQALGDAPALVHFADEILLGHLHGVQEHLAEMGRSADERDRASFDALALHVDQQEGDAALLRTGIGADERETPVGMIGARGPDLLPLDQIMIAHIDAFGLERGEVGTGARLGKALAPAGHALGDAGEMLRLLRLGAELQKRRTEHRIAGHLHRVERPDAPHFLRQNLGLLMIERAAAINGRPGGSAPALFRHPIAPENPVGIGLGIRRIVLIGDRILEGERGREVGFQPAARLGAKRLTHDAASFL